jgi:hypothetical protein
MVKNEGCKHFCMRDRELLYSNLGKRSVHSQRPLKDLADKAS